MFEFDLSKAVNSTPIGKVRKKDIQTCLRDITDSKILAPDEVHKLIGLCLRYWTPSLKKPKDAFDWVTLACGNDESRTFNPWIYEDYLTATDGHRIHLTPNAFYSEINGFSYVDRALRELLICDTEPPPIVPFMKIRKERLATDAILLKLTDLKFKNSDQIIIPSEIGNIFVNQKYVRDTFSLNNEMLFYPGKDVLEVLLFESTQRDQICFLMPMRG